ncbi:hypothetical protein ABH925_000440 [Streptacidiphilus sp. EB129]
MGHWVTVKTTAVGTIAAEVAASGTTATRRSRP